MKSHGYADAPPIVDSLGGGPRLAPAEVVFAEARTIVVSFGVQQVEVQMAMLDYEPSRGDRVLVLGNDASGYFLTGVLATAHPRPKLKVEHCSKTGATIISVETGDLEVVASRGAVRMSIVDRLGQALHRLGLTRRCAELRHEHVQIDAGRFELESDRVAVKAQEGCAEVDSISMIARRASIQAATLLSKVENAYHIVAGLWQLAADRTRMVVHGTSHHKAARLYSNADDVKVKADKIHLG